MRLLRLLVPLLATLGSLLLPVRVQALEPSERVTQYPARSWGTDDGLPQSSAMAIAQTPDGYLWIATQEGLVRFDGVQFTVFDRHTTPALHHNFLASLLVDREGRLWIGTVGGGLTSEDHGRFTHHGPEEGLEGKLVFALHQAPDGSVWVGTEAGLFRLGAGGRFTRYTTAQGLSHDEVRAIADDPRGGLWIGTDGGGLTHFDGQRFTPFAHNAQLSSQAIRVVHVDRRGVLWVGTSGGGLDRIEGDEVRVLSTSEIGSDGAWSLLEDRDGSLWVGTDGGGLVRIRADGERERLTPAEGLSDGVVYSLFEDREGSLWAGTQSGGLNQLRDSKFVPFGTREGLASDNVWSILPTRDGSILFGTSRGVSRLRDGQITPFRGPGGPLRATVYALEEDPSGALWVGTSHGLQRWREGQAPEDLSTVPGLGNFGISALLLEPSGRLWVGGRKVGLTALQGGAVRVYGADSGLKGGFVLSLREDRAGVLWVGTTEGLFRFQGDRFLPVAPEALGGIGINDSYEDGRGVLWLGTERGLKRVEHGRVFSFTAAQGLPDESMFRVLEDDQGFLWISSNRGVTRWNKAELERLAAGEKILPTVERYGKSDGMRSNECNGVSDPAGVRAADGRLWFPTDQGAVRVDPAHLLRNPLPPPVVIESVLADGASIPAGGKLAPGTRQLEIHYTGLSFRAPGRVTFKYRLDGFDPGWIEAGTRRVAYYTGLPPGQYRFEVMAANADGVWSPRPASFSFEARPLFRQTGWFDALLVLGGLALAGALFWLRMRSMKRRERELLARVAERDEFITLASHELRTPLAALQLAVTAARRGTSDPETGLSVIHRQTRRLSDLVEKLLEVAMINREGVTLSLEEVDLSALVKQVLEERREELERSGSNVQLDAPAELVGRWDRRRLEHVFRQLLSNAIRHGGGSPIAVRLAREGAHAQLTVRDSGPGIPHALRGHLFDRIPPRSALKWGGFGVGLWTSRQLVEAMGGRLRLVSDGGKGACFRIDLPMSSPG